MYFPNSQKQCITLDQHHQKKLAIKKIMTDLTLLFFACKFIRFPCQLVVSEVSARVGVLHLLGWASLDGEDDKGIRLVSGEKQGTNFVP